VFSDVVQWYYFNIKFIKINYFFILILTHQMISNLIFFPSKKTISALKTNTPFVFKLVRAKVEGSIGDS